MASIKTVGSFLNSETNASISSSDGTRSVISEKEIGSPTTACGGVFIDRPFNVRPVGLTLGDEGERRRLIASRRRFLSKCFASSSAKTKPPRVLATAELVLKA